MSGGFPGGRASRPTSMYGPPLSRGGHRAGGSSMSISSLSAVVGANGGAGSGSGAGGSPSPANSPVMGSTSSLASAGSGNDKKDD